MMSELLSTISDSGLDLPASKLFEAWTDPASGMTSFILTKKVSPIQQSFYFVTPSMTTDARYLWIQCADGVSEDRTLALVDLTADTITHLPETSYRDGPFVDPDDGSVYFCRDLSVFKRSPEPGGEVILVNTIPEDVHRGRPCGRMVSHLTRSADGREFFLDAQFGDEYVAGSLPVDGGDYQLWQRFGRCYNHAQFNPADSDLALIAQDWWPTPDGVRKYDNRMWTIRRGHQAEPVFQFDNFYGHEWWDADGRTIWYIDYNKGTYKVDAFTKEDVHVWPAGNGHSHCSTCGRYLAGDVDVYSWALRGCSVGFFNTITGQEANIVSDMPRHPLIDDYHLHPHPQFAGGNEFIVYTTTVRGEPDIALTRTADLIAATS